MIPIWLQIISMVAVVVLAGVAFYFAFLEPR